MRRAIPEGYSYDPKALKPLAKMLWSMSVSLGHALTANRQFTRLKSNTISPDGMVGGRGYVMSVKDVRKALYDACEALSMISDTIHDEINAPHWRPKLAELEKSELDDVEHLLGDANQILDDPEGQAEEMLEEEEKEGESKGAPWHHPAVNKKRDKHEPRSQIPGAGDKETLPSQGANPAGSDHPYNRQTKQASADPMVARVLNRVLGNSSIPVQTLPGPRVQHLDRGDEDQTGPFGTYNRGEEMELSDQWRRDEGVGGEYNYPSDWDGEFNEKSAHLKPEALKKLREVADQKGDHHLKALSEALDKGNWKLAGMYYQMLRAKEALHDVPEEIAGELALRHSRSASAAIPDAEMDNTPTEGFDFGIGRGNGNDAHGQGAGGYGEGNPGAPDSNPGGGTGNKGVYGPQSGLPNDPAGKKTDDNAGDPMAVTELQVGGRTPRLATEVVLNDLLLKVGTGELPQDVAPDVARADYYDGPKSDNMQNVAPSTVGATALPGEAIPAKETPLKPRPAHNQEHMFAETQLPGDEGNVTHEFDKDTGPETGYRYERVDQPYVKWDDTTPEMRPDPTYQRDVQGPFVHNDLTRASNG